MASSTAKRRRTEKARIADPAARLVTYSKRRKGLFNKAYELSRLCGARVAVVVFSPAGKPCSFGDPSADEIISDYLLGGGGGGGVMPPMGLTQWAEWVQTEWDACATEEDLASLILKYEAVRDCAREKLKALEDSHKLSEQEIDSLFESLEGQGPALAALLTEDEGFLTSPENPAAGGGSSAVGSTPAVSDLEGCGSNVAGGGSLGAGSTPNRSEDCIVDRHGFWSSPEDSAVGGGNLEDCCVDSHGFWSSPEDSAVCGGNSGVEPALSDLGEYGYNPNEFVGLEDLGVLL
ncbi:MADS-box transcription factor 50-like [Syzygium oleosum]|uniref:MADS-box transcription factor 50-like n=1 Tax=Syzygium oleosum TaxID=219896 RepID=UPI0024BA76D2|nr:MADS-box transcription factor 50-like [Syzygium oleosum]